MPETPMEVHTTPSVDVPPQEQHDIDALIGRMRDLMTKRDEGHAQQRDVHMKMLGLLRAEFTVPELPPDLRVGLFATPGTYKAWVRYSNSASAAEPDIKGDIRGMAIKLMGVPGRKVLDSHADATTHDFLVVTALNFPARTAAEIDALVANVVQGPLWVKLWFLLTHPRAAWILLTTMVKHANMLQNLYCSVVPYRFGSQAVKYIAVPQVEQAEGLPSRPGHDFLRDRLVRDLAKGEARFDFCVQFQRDEACMPLDDAFRAWSLQLSPPRKVATLRILQQTFDTDAIRTYGENLSFTPWHCLPDHLPLGALNRTRRAVYDTLSTYRRERNQAPLREPSDWDV
jgi:hypothetical protein